MEIKCKKCHNDLKKERIIYREITVKNGSVKVEKVAIMCPVCGREIDIKNVNKKVIKDLNLGDDVWDI